MIDFSIAYRFQMASSALRCLETNSLVLRNTTVREADWPTYWLLVFILVRCKTRSGTQLQPLFAFMLQCANTKVRVGQSRSMSDVCSYTYYRAAIKLEFVCSML